MIDKDQLRELGWSEELISEVTRMSETINQRIVDFPSIIVPDLQQRSVSGKALYFSKKDIKTDHCLTVTVESE
jgi:hypothetical protein